jgi:hypothetical protein
MMESTADVEVMLSHVEERRFHRFELLFQDNQLLCHGAERVFGVAALRGELVERRFFLSERERAPGGVLGALSLSLGKPSETAICTRRRSR